LNGLNYLSKCGNAANSRKTSHRANQYCASFSCTKNFHAFLVTSIESLILLTVFNSFTVKHTRRSITQFSQFKQSVLLSVTVVLHAVGL